jgi:hypothetical protein
LGAGRSDIGCAAAWQGARAITLAAGVAAELDPRFHFHTPRLVGRPSRARGSPTEVQPDEVRIDPPSGAVPVRVSSAGLTNKELVRMIELQLIANDELPEVIDQTCETRQVDRKQLRPPGYDL